MDTRFHCVYLLTSLDPRCAGDYYIGYTVDPLRRLRQHNGEIVSGAWRTKRRGRPWALVLCVSGFGEDRVALKFEWCWQHPAKSARLKSHVGSLRGLHRLHCAAAVLHLLLRDDLFARLQLTLHIFEPARFAEVTAELRQRVPSLPRLPETSLLRIEEITKERFASQYLKGEGDGCGAGDGCIYFVTAQLNNHSTTTTDDVAADIPPEGENMVGCMRSCRYLCEEDILRHHARVKELLELNQYPCSLCSLPLQPPYFVRCVHTPFCSLRAHLTCLAMWFTYESTSKGDVMTCQSTQLACNNGNNNRGKDNVDTSSFSGGLSTGRPLSSFPVSINNTSTSPKNNMLPLPDSSCNISASQNSSTGPPPLRSLLPCQPSPCPLCNEPLQWGALVHDLKRRTVLEKRWVEHQRREKMEAALTERLQRIENLSLTERQRRRKGGGAQLGQKRQRGGCHAATAAAPSSSSSNGGGDGGGVDVSADIPQQGHARDSRDHNDMNNESSVSFPPQLDEGNELHVSGGVDNSRCVANDKYTGRPLTGGGGVERKNMTMADIYEEVLQLTEFNLDEWLDA